MSDALMGHTGYIGSTLKRQRRFDAFFDSKNIYTAGDIEYDLVVCAAAPSQKWIANSNPDADRAGIQKLIAALAKVRCSRFVLLSTVDVFVDPNGAYEDTPIQLRGLQPYGLHRHELELFVVKRFPGALIVRLPALVGPGLRKNALHDLHHSHEIHKIDSRGTFQFYPTVNLWSDLQRALDLRLTLAHFATQPMTIAEVAHEALGQRFDHVPNTGSRQAYYDLRSRHAAAFGGADGYLYCRRVVLTAVRAYSQSEPRRLNFA
jgi:hypothetical protein